MGLPPKPEQVNNLEFVRILTPYVFTHEIVGGRSVLDIGCGFGYGTWLIASNGARQVISSDLDKTKASQAHRLCSSFKNVGTLVMDAQRLGFKDHSFQVVTCFEVIEHTNAPDMLLSEVGRILKTDGVLLLTSPNRAMRLLPFQRPWNPEHLREYTLRTLQKSLHRHFPSFELLGIYGEPPFYQYYKKMWKQNPFYFYFGFITPIIRRFIPSAFRRLVINKLGYAKTKQTPIACPDLLGSVDPVADYENWPFYVNNISKNCLNFFAICGLDNQIVQRSAKEIRRTT